VELFKPKYVFDSGSLIDLKNYPNDVFTSLWDNFSQMIADGEIISSSEVLRELQDYDDDIGKWAKTEKKIFVKPSIDEQLEVKEILAKYPNLVKESYILSGQPYADPFVIAQAKIYGAVLIHQEKFKPNAHKIPNVCKKLGVKEMSLFEFFREVGWKF